MVIPTRSPRHQRCAETDLWQAGVVSSPVTGPIPGASQTRGLSRGRRAYGMAVALVGGPVLAAGLLPFRGALGLDTVLLAFVLVCVAASAVGGVLPAMAAALLSFGLANFFFAPPYGTFTVASTAELADLLVFLAVAVSVGVITEIGARVRVRSERDRGRAEWLASLEAGPSHDRTLESVLAEARRTYGVDAVALTSSGRVLASIGQPGSDAKVVVASAGEQLQLELRGPERIGADRAPLEALALTAGRLWRTQGLAEQARRAEELSRIDELRASLLAAVGHDLRGPLATIRAAAATLGETDLDLSPAERAELLSSIDEHVERLNNIIANLLDLSRLQAGALSVHLQPTSVLEVLAGVIGLGAHRVMLDVPEDLPLITADAGLLERVIANLVSNADRHLPAGQQVLVAASVVRHRVAIQVVDHGPGVAPERFEEIFRPFQHFSDRAGSGVGLGLAIARGFTEAMGGELTPSPTPGGGLTMTVTLEVADAANLNR
jgi:K+-sensing histidine kinase KdpD